MRFIPLFGLETIGVLNHHLIIFEKKAKSIMAGNLNSGLKVSYYYCISTFKTIVGLVTNKISQGRNSAHEKKILTCGNLALLKDILILVLLYHTDFDQSFVKNLMTQLLI